MTPSGIERFPVHLYCVRAIAQLRGIKDTLADVFTFCVLPLRRNDRVVDALGKGRVVETAVFIISRVLINVRPEGPTGNIYTVPPEAS